MRPKNAKSQIPNCKKIPNPEGIVSSSPGLRACELPWEIVQTASQPQRGCGRAAHPQTQPAACPDVVYRGWGLLVPPRWTQGSSFLATLGFVAESLWDSRNFALEMWVMISLRERAGVRASFSLQLIRPLNTYAFGVGVLGALLGFGAWTLELLWVLELGAWSFFISPSLPSLPQSS